MNFIKEKLQHVCFPMNVAKFLRTAFFIEHLQWLFLFYFTIYQILKRALKTTNNFQSLTDQSKREFKSDYTKIYSES